MTQDQSEVPVPPIRRRVLACGKVQGVYFRESCRAEAERLGATGYVENRPDGTVEAVFEGAPEVVDALVEWCRLGPPRAEVESISVNTEAPSGLDAFIVRRSH